MVNHLGFWWWKSNSISSKTSEDGSSNLPGAIMRIQKSLQGLKGEDVVKCPECGSKDLVKDKGEIFCKKCGYVIEE